MVPRADNIMPTSSKDLRAKHREETHPVSTRALACRSSPQVITPVNTDIVDLRTNHIPVTPVSDLAVHIAVPISSGMEINNDILLEVHQVTTNRRRHISSLTESDR